MTPEQANSTDELQGETWRSVVAAGWRAPATRWLLLIACLVCAAGWMWELRPLEPQWGTVGEWVSGLATAGGLIFAGQQIRHASQARADEAARRGTEEQERREAQARSVALSSEVNQRSGGRFFLDYKLMNGSDYPIDNVVLVVADPGAEYVDLARQQGTAVQRVLGTMLPKETQEGGVEVTFTSDPVFGQLNSLAQVLFLDTWNQNWARGPMVLERMEAPPRIC